MNKHNRNRHLAIRNIQRTSWFGTMTYSEARRKYKAGYRAIPVGKGYFARWFLLNFGSYGLTLTQTRKLGEEYTLISEHAESAQFKATMRYDVKLHCLVFNYRGLNSKWRFALSLELITPLIDDGRLAQRVTRSAETDISDWCLSNNVENQHTRTGISHYSCSEEFNEIVSHSIRDRMQYPRLTPIFAGYGITKVYK